MRMIRRVNESRISTERDGEKEISRKGSKKKRMGRKNY